MQGGGGWGCAMCCAVCYLAGGALVHGVAGRVGGVGAADAVDAAHGRLPGSQGAGGAWGGLLHGGREDGGG